MITDLPDEHSIQYQAPHREPVAGCGFDDSGARVPVIGFDYPESEPEHDRFADAGEVLGAFLQHFASMTPNRAGKHILALAYLSGKTTFRTDAQLAKRLGISASRVSHLLRELSPDFGSVSKCGRRQKKPVKRNVEAYTEGLTSI